MLLSLKQNFDDAIIRLLSASKRNNNKIRKKAKLYLQALCIVFTGEGVLYRMHRWVVNRVTNKERRQLKLTAADCTTDHRDREVSRHHARYRLSDGP